MIKMKVIVFGGTGFIGSHVVEQLQLAGHHVTTAVRTTSNTTFLKSLGVNIVRIDFSDPGAIGKAMDGKDVVYNCTADPNQNMPSDLDAPVEIKLTKTLIETAALHGVSRFIQLSTIVIYDLKSNEPIDESYISQPEYPIQKVAMERERIVKEIGKNAGIETIILRPASTIGARDTKSFFSGLFTAHTHDQFPIVGEGDRKVSLIDTRDIGRAMEFLGVYNKPKDDKGVYLVKGFDVTWYELKKEMDRITGRNAIVNPISTSEQTFMIKNFSVNRIWNDNKLRKLGFQTRYSLSDAVGTSVHDLLNRAE